MRFSLAAILLISYHRSFDGFAAAQEGLRASDARGPAASSSSTSSGAGDAAAVLSALAKFTSWADEHGKAYRSEEERAKRLLVWMENDGAFQVNRQSWLRLLIHFRKSYSPSVERE